MTNTGLTPTAEPVFGERSLSWGWLLGLGILMLVLGLIGLGMTFWLTILTVIYFGVLAIIGGVAQLIDAFRGKGWKSIAWHVLIGIVYLAAGAVLIFMPLESAFWLTLFLAAALIVVGVMRIIMAFQLGAATSAKIWVVLSGLISIILGVMIYAVVEVPAPEALATAEGLRAWVEQWGWVIGLFVAVDFIVHGVALITIAFAARSAREESPGRNAGAPTAA